MDGYITRKDKNSVAILLAVLFISAIIIIFYTVFGSINNNLTLSQLFYYLGRFSALLGFLFISTLIISGDLAIFFDKFFGIDRIIKTQRKFAILTYFVVFSHPSFMVLSKVVSLKNIIPNFSNLPLAMGSVSIYIFAGIMISSLLYKRISYRAWQYIHILTYILFFFVLYHAIYNGSSIYTIQIKILFSILTILVITGIIYRTNYKLKQRKNRFIVKEVKPETDDIFTIIAEPNKPISFNPGQFFFLRLEGRKLYARHPFSVSSSPLEKDIQFTVKNTGRFTKEAYNLKPGDEIKIEGPFGNFILNEEKKNLVFIAGGVGITPFMSMIKYHENKPIKQNILLLYSSKTEKDTIFKKEIDSVKGKWFKKVYVLSKEDKKGYETGRIDKEILIKYIKDFHNKKFYICGPQSMNHDVSKDLKELGVKKHDIVFEDFFW